jgi:hypothetical protein
VGVSTKTWCHQFTELHHLRKTHHYPTADSLQAIWRHTQEQNPNLLYITDLARSGQEENVWK